jgi:hypothetical protein
MQLANKLDWVSVNEQEKKISWTVLKCEFSGISSDAIMV